MSTLLVLLPSTAPPATGAQDYDYWFSVDAQAPAPSRGTVERASAAALPKADRVMALIADEHVSWMPAQVPPLKGPRLRAALVGVLEEQMLEDPERLHLAVLEGAGEVEPTGKRVKRRAKSEEASAAADSRTWVAVMAREPLRLHLAALEAAGIAVEALLPLSWPQAAPGGHVHVGSDGRPRLRAWTADGVITAPLDSGGIRAWLGDTWMSDAVVSATPAAAAQTEQWLGRKVQVRSDSERAWAARRAPVNLLQFEMTPRQRGWQRVHRAWQTVQTPAWRPFRWGVIGLVLVQVVGLNVMAWQQRRAVEARHDEQAQLLRQSFPQVRVIRDAPAQMQRETEQLRGSAGQIGPGDLEYLLGAVAHVWPQGQAQLPGLRYESNQLLLTGLAAPMRTQLRDGLVSDAALRVADEGESLSISLRPTSR